MSAADTPAVVVSRLVDGMRSHGLEVSGRLDLSRIGAGQSNLTYLATDQRGSRWIVRRPPLGELLESAHDVEREYRILTALAGADVAVPAVYVCLERGDAADVPVVVMEHVDGQVLDGFASLHELDAPARAGLLAALPKALAAIHAVDITHTGLSTLGSHGPYAPRQLKRWSAQWDRSRTRDLPALDQMTELLVRHVPISGGVSLIHGDFSPHNSIVDPASGAVRAVLDWELSTLGEPLADVGTTLAYWSVADVTGPRRTGGEDDRSAAERAQFVRAYLELSGAGQADVAYWHALALWRLAIITEGVIRRAVDEPGNAGGRTAPENSDVDRLLQAAREVARDAGLE